MSVKTIHVQRNKVAKCQNGSPNGPRRNTFASRNKVYHINTYMQALPFETINEVHETFMNNMPKEPHHFFTFISYYQQNLHDDHKSFSDWRNTSSN
jgi:hypothetical protein